MNRTLLMGIAGALCALAVQGASAQWAWKDDAGHTVFSDQPPPNNIPASHIVKSPTGSSASSSMTAAPAPAADPNAPDASKPKSLADQDLEFKKRLKDNADAAKKAQEAQAAADAKQQRCAQARTALNTINSGQRLATTDADGNRSYLDDSQRQAQAARAQQALEGC